jgi:5'-deoxynucleotidase YfbR-like HD superfamily hydrolase
MAYCRLCGKDRDLVERSPFYGLLENESTKKTKICRVCDSIWDDQTVKPYTKVLKTQLWDSNPQNGLDAMLRQMRIVNYMLRYAAEITANPESLGEHMCSVMLISYQIATDLKKQGIEVDMERLWILSMFHDIAEPFTGDIPTPLKSPALKGEVDRMESLAYDVLEKWGIDVSVVRGYDKGNVEDIESRIVKCADFISAVTYISEEYFVGTAKMAEVRNRTMRKFRKWVKADWEKELYDHILRMVDEQD